MMYPPKEWSRSVAAFVADALIDAGVLKSSDADRAIDAIEEEIFVRLSIQGHPLPESLRDWKIELREMSPGAYEATATRSSGNVVSRQGTDDQWLVWQVIVDAIEMERRAGA